MEHFNSSSFAFFPGKEKKPLITNEDSKDNCHYFRQQRKTIYLLCIILQLLIGLCFKPVPVEAQIPSGLNLSFNEGEQSVHINFLIKHTYLAGINQKELVHYSTEYLKNGILSASLTGTDYKNFYNVSNHSSIDNASTSYTEIPIITYVDSSKTIIASALYIIDIRLNLTEENRNVKYIRLQGTWNRTRTDSKGSDSVIKAINIMDSITIPFTSINASSVKLSLRGNDSALIKWTPTVTAWANDANFVITRINNTTRAKAAINLSKEDYFKGFYVDDEIAVCNEYSYTLQVVPPKSSGYTAFAPIKTTSTITPTEIGTVLNLTASKGYFPDRAELRWSTQGGFDYFIIKRTPYGINNYIQLSSVTGSSISNYEMDDSKGTPGVYYKYMVIGVVNCNNKPVYSKDTLYAIGFRSPTGSIYGRVTYENGQGVQDAAVRLQSKDAAQLGKSVYLDGSANSYLKLDSLNTSFTDSAFTVEAWIKPDEAAPKSQVIFSRGNQYELGFNTTGQLYFSYNGKMVTGIYTNPNNSFVHIAGIYSKDSLFLMLNELIIDSAANQYTAAANVDKVVYIGRNAAGNNFKGYIDEMRVWNIALSKSLVARDYTRLMSGGENGLVAYWRFDESIKDQFYDASHKGEQYNQNDGLILGKVIHTDTIPSPGQLSLKAYTDSTGNYMISGIPFTGNGTTYAIVPLLGTHQFDPGSVNRLISSSSTEFTVDFKDKSSFAVSGAVYYSGGTVPASKVQFKIDGKYAQQSNGDIIETDESGKFTIYVPVGTHEVKAVKNNHVFEKGGRITDYLLHDLNYQNTISGIELHDSTTIRFIGRVAGGAIEEAYPLGHSLSTNNLGKQLSITMTLPTTGSGGEIYSGSKNKTESTVIIKHLLPSSQTDSAKTHKSRVVYQKNKIVIYPDSLTGEFEADIIPEKFLITSVDITGWNNILDKPATIDFSDQLVTQYSIYTYKDSVINNDDTTITSYTDSVAYNASYKFIKRVSPTLSIAQLSQGKELNYFGDNTYKYQLLNGSSVSIPLVDTSSTGAVNYIFGYPVFSKGTNYQFLIKAYEQYKFYKNDKMVVGKVSNVPTKDGVVSILNKIRDDATAAETLSLDEKGENIHGFHAGAPDLAAHGLKAFSASLKYGAAGTVNWYWKGDITNMEVLDLGSKNTGTDFVTAGPDELLMVLRDPPGSRSYSYAEKGYTTSNSITYTGGVDQVGDQSLEIDLGEKLVTFQGIGFGVISTPIEITNTAGLGIHHEEHYTHNNVKTTTTVLTTRFQTSDAPTFVGAPADLFVGYSTNITYGFSNNITIIKKSEKNTTDSIIYDPGSGSEYVVVSRAGINLGEKFGTLFAYPQQHIEKVLLPNLINIRNSLLMDPSTSPADAQAAANLTKQEVYVSKYPSTDTAHFGKSNNNTIALGADAKKLPFYDGKSYKIYFPTNVPDFQITDTIMVLNQWMDSWIQRLADNEKAKLTSKLLQNYSFHAGSPVQYSEQSIKDTATSNSFSFVISGNLSHSQDVKLFGNGFIYKMNESLGTNQGGSINTDKNTSKTFGFVLASDGTDDYFSVDVNRLDDGTFAFRNKGGQSACPYEGETVTKYYQPGAVIDQPTQRIEVPKLYVDKPVINNIPSSRKASYTLSLRNESEAKLPATFILGYTDNDSIKGATIAIDGTAIGGSGRAVVVQYGQTVTKVLTLTKGPDAMDYNNIPILLHSSCQYDPTGYQATIADTVLISAHFIPSCSDIHLKAPVDKWVVNSESPVNTNGKRYLPITIDQFDVTNSLFDHIELQYKPASSSTWITAMQFFADSAKFKDAQGEKQFITNAQGINYNLVMDDASFNDQNYDIQAVSYCRLSPGNYVTTQSNMVSGIKDSYFPRLFGSPQPANGVLGVSDEIRLNFNEPIAAGLLTYSDFQVTGIRNGVQGDHTVSVRLDGKADYLASEFDKNLTAKNITVEMWVLPDNVANGTVFSHGNINKSMELSFTADNHLQVTMGTKVIESDKPLDYKQGEWAHIALVYNATTSTVAAFYNFTEVIHNVAVDKYDGIGPFEFGRSISKQGNFFAGKMHQVEIWTEALTATAIQLNSLTQLSGTENSLLAYYPMNEGKGKIAFDKAHSSNAQLTGNWNTPAGKSISFNGTGYVKMNTAAAPITSNMDYTLGLWFKADPGQTNVTLASNGKGDGTDVGGSLNLFSLGFEDGLLTYRNNGFKIQANGNYLDNNWHQVAIAVNRNSGNAQFFVDGLLNKYFDAKNLGGIAAAYTYLGARAYQNEDSSSVTLFDRYYKGNMDEFRIWNTYLNQTLISKNNNVHLKGNELGLMAYYPFEKYFEFQNNTTMGFTLSDMALQRDPNLTIPDAIAVNAAENDDMAPIKDRGPVENLQFDYVVNNDALIINLLEAKQAIDKTIVTFQIKNVRDMNGNPIQSPVTWTAYIDRNQLKWTDDQLNLSKDVYAPMQFESYLVNNGGNIQNFRLSNLPSWLTADPVTGTVDPKGRQKITFTVNEGLNIGRYDEHIYMRNDNNESEALAINLQVKGKQPDWKVDPAVFKYNMSIYGKIRVNSVFSNNAEDMLAAFVNGKCVGVTKNTYNADNDLWYTFLTVYSDTLRYNNMEFRIWQANTGKTFQAIPSQPVTFSNDAVAGTAGNPIIFDGKEMLFQNIVLNQHWNWISFNVMNANAGNINTALSNGNWQSGDIVKNEELGFDQYSSASGWVGYLKAFNNTSLFMLNTANAQTLSISGIAVDVTKTPITLKGNRWSYISYLPQVNMKVKDALAGYNASDEDMIKSQSGFAMYDSRNGWVGNLTYLEPGKGYMVYRKANTDTTFVYPNLSGSLTNSGGRLMKGMADNSTRKANDLETPVAGNFNFAENMTVAAIVGNEFQVLPGDLILAYVNGALRSKAKAVSNPVINRETWFLNISGVKAQPVYFMIERNGQIIAESTTPVSLRPNSIVGTVSKPLVIHVKKVMLGVNIYPNPFSGQVNININLTEDGSTPQAHEVQLSVYDVSGQLIIRHSKEQINGSIYQTTWDGKTANGTECARGIYFINIRIDGVLKIYKVVKG